MAKFSAACPTRTFRGVILQNSNTGQGLFNGNKETGSVELASPP